MRAVVVLVLAACQAKKTQPPPPPPAAPADASTSDECRRRAQDESTRSDRDISRALAAQKLELFAPPFVQTPFDDPQRGANASPEMIAQAKAELAPFEHKANGEVVTWKRGEASYTGRIVWPIKEGWIIAKRGTEVFLVKPARWREVVCEDTGPCADRNGPKPLLFALPPGMTFGGTLDLDAERVSLTFTGGPAAPCPP